MSFHSVVFMEDVSYGSSGGPTFSSAVAETESGAEQVVSRWDDPRYAFNVAYGIKKPSQLSAVREFFIARKGPANGFLYKDWQDFHSGPGHAGHDSSPGVQDQLIGTGDGSTTVFQLVKAYTSGPTTYWRRIRRPKQGTVRVWVGATELVEGVGFSVNYSTGRVTLTSAPSSGALVKASFQFYVPVRFKNDEVMSRIDSFGTGAMEPIELLEIVDADADNTGEFCYGGSDERLFGTNTSIDTSARDWTLAATTTGLSVSLPDPTAVPPGCPVFYVKNGGSNTFTLRDHAGASLASLAANTAVEVILSKTTGGSKVWYAA